MKSERARERESERVRESESEGARERGSKRVRLVRVMEQSEREREPIANVLNDTTIARERPERTHCRSFVHESERTHRRRPTRFDNLAGARLENKKDDRRRGSSSKPRRPHPLLFAV